MIKADWIVCETSDCWTPALRVALSRDALFQLREVPDLDQLSPMLHRWPRSLVGLEVCEDNFSKMLSWISDASRCYPFARFVAFVDREFWLPSSRQLAIEAILREAGILEIAFSPRRLGPILELARRHSAQVAKQIAAKRATLSLEEQLWEEFESLPFSSKEGKV